MNTYLIAIISLFFLASPESAYAAGQEKKCTVEENETVRALHEAIYSGDDDKAIDLIASCESPNAPLNGIPALFEASRLGRLAVVKELLKTGANPNCRLYEGYSVEQCIELRRQGVCGGFCGGDTPIYAAAANGNVEIIRVLLAFGADKQINKSGNGMRRQPYDLAIKNSFYDAAKLLYVPGWRNPLKPGGPTRLTQAICSGNVEMSLWIIDNGGPVEEPVEVMCLVAKKCDRTFIPVMERLLEKGLDPNTLEYGTGLSLLHLAVIAGNTEMVRLLLRFGANPRIKPSPSRGAEVSETPYDLAVKLNCEEVAEILRGAVFGGTIENSPRAVDYENETYTPE